MGFTGGKRGVKATAISTWSPRGVTRAKSLADAQAILEIAPERTVVIRDANVLLRQMPYNSELKVSDYVNALRRGLVER